MINGNVINGLPISDEEVYQLALRNSSADWMHIVEIGYRGDSAVYGGWTDYVLKLSDRPFLGHRPVVKAIPSYRRQIGDEFTGQVSASIGELELSNADGLLDLWHNLAWDGQPVRVFQGHPSWDRDRFRLVFAAIVEGVASADATTVKLRLRGRDYGANGPIQTDLIESTSGTTASANQPKPLVYGPVFNVAPPLVDDVNLVYQIHDGALEAVHQVRDGGISYRTGLIAISAVDAGTDTLSTASAHGFLRHTRVRCEVGSLPDETTWYTLRWNGTVFASIAYGTAVCATSRNGIRWTQHAMPASRNWYGLDWNGTVYCAVGINTAKVAISGDGETWTEYSLPASRQWRYLANDGDTLLAVAQSTDKCATSADNGQTWTERTLPSSEAWRQPVWCAAHAVFVLAAELTDTVAVSDDRGATWTAYATLPAVRAWGPMASNGEEIVCLAYGTDKAAVSTDGGLTWTEHTMVASRNWWRIRWTGTVYVAVALSTNKCGISVDGRTWTEGTLPASAFWRTCEWNGEVLCAIETASLSTISDDGGATWSSSSNTLPAPLAANTDYWVIADGLTTTDFKLAATRGGSAIDITGTDTGATILGYHWTADLTAGTLALDSTPAGQITVDAETATNLAADILPEALAAEDVDAASQAAFASTCAQELGLYIAERRNRLEVADEVARSVGAWYGRDRYGLLRFGRLESSYSYYHIPLGEDDILLDSLVIERLVPPRKRHRLKYRHNWTNQAGALFAGVSAERQALFSADDSITRQTLGDDEGPNGEEFHALAQLPDAKPSLMAHALAAKTEADRLDALFYGWGVVFSAVVGRIGTEVDIGSIVRLTHPRFGLAGGVNLPCIYAEDNPSAGTTRLKFFAALAAYTPGQL